MNAIVRLVVALAALLAVFGALAADEHPLRGQWQVSDPERPGESATITFGPTHMEMPGEKPVPYRIEGSGDVLTLIVQGQNRSPPGVIKLLSDDEATMQFPGGPEIRMTRVAGPSAPAAAVTRQSAGGALADEITAALLPNGVPTRFEPINRSLEQLLSAGWEMVQIAAAQGGFSVWLRDGKVNALCILVPKLYDESGGALSDCRRLN